MLPLLKGYDRLAAQHGVFDVLKSSMPFRPKAKLNSACVQQMETHCF